MDYELSARQRLGALVRQARRDAGYVNTQHWAQKAGRSDRQLLGLERGEKVGADTYAAVAKALGWPLERIYEVLDGGGEQAGSTALTEVGDDALVDELRRRLRRAGGEHDQQRSAPIAGGKRKPTSREEYVAELERLKAGPEDRERLLAMWDSAHPEVDEHNDSETA